MKRFSLCCSGSQSAGPKAGSITWELVRNVDSLAPSQIVNLAPLEVGPASAVPSPPGDFNADWETCLYPYVTLKMPSTYRDLMKMQVSRAPSFKTQLHLVQIGPWEACLVNKYPRGIWMQSPRPKLREALISLPRGSRNFLQCSSSLPRDSPESCEWSWYHNSASLPSHSMKLAARVTYCGR